jgi:hypothetical protein
MTNKNPNPMVLAGLRKHEDVMRRRGRAYGLGERHPDKLDVTDDDFARSRFWDRRRRLVQNGSLIGSKY